MKNIVVQIILVLSVVMAHAQTTPRATIGQSVRDNANEISVPPTTTNTISTNPAAAPTVTNFVEGKLYKFINVNSKLFLGAADFIQTEGNDFRQYADGGQDNITWRIEKQPLGNFIIKSVDENVCMAIDGEAPNQIASLVNFNSANGQKWIFEKQANGDIKIKNILANKYLGVQEGSFVEGARVQLSTNTPENFILWRAVEVVAERNYKSVNAGTYIIKNVNSGMYIAPSEQEVTEGADCTQQNKETTNTGKLNFDLELQQDGSYLIIQKNSGLCLELDNLFNAPVLAKVSNSNTLKWKILETENKTYIIKSAFTGHILCIRDGVKNEGANLTQTAKNNEKLNYTQWVFEKNSSLPNVAIDTPTNIGNTQADTKVILNGNYSFKNSNGRSYCVNLNGYGSITVGASDGYCSMDKKIDFVIKTDPIGTAIFTLVGNDRYTLFVSDGNKLRCYECPPGKGNKWKLIKVGKADFKIQSIEQPTMFVTMNGEEELILAKESNAFKMKQRWILEPATNAGNTTTNNNNGTNEINAANLIQKTYNGHFQIISKTSSKKLAVTKNGQVQNVSTTNISAININSVIGISTEDGKSAFGPLTYYYYGVTEYGNANKIELLPNEYFWKFLEIDNNNCLIESIPFPGFYLTEEISSGSLKLLQIDPSNSALSQIWAIRSLATSIPNSPIDTILTNDVITDPTDNELYEVTFTPSGSNPICGYEDRDANDPIELGGTLKIKCYIDDNSDTVRKSKFVIKDKNKKSEVLFYVDGVEIGKVNKTKFVETNSNMCRNYIINKKSINQKAYINLETDFWDTPRIGLIIPHSMALTPNKEDKGISSSGKGRNILISDILAAPNGILVITDEVTDGTDPIFYTYKLTIKKLLKEKYN